MCGCNCYRKPHRQDSDDEKEEISKRLLFIYNAMRENGDDVDDDDIVVEENISCSNPKCPDGRKWYKFADVGIKKAPEGDWFCGERCAREYASMQVEAEKKKQKIAHVEAPGSDLVIRGPSKRQAAVRARQEIQKTLSYVEEEAEDLLELAVLPKMTSSKKKRL